MEKIIKILSPIVAGKKHLVNTLKYVHFYDGRVLACSSYVLAEIKTDVAKMISYNVNNTEEQRGSISVIEVNQSTTGFVYKMVKENGEKFTIPNFDVVRISNFREPDSKRTLNVKTLISELKDVNLEFIQMGECVLEKTGVIKLLSVANKLGKTDLECWVFNDRGVEFYANDLYMICVKYFNIFGKPTFVV